MRISKILLVGSSPSSLVYSLSCKFINIYISKLYNCIIYFYFIKTNPYKITSFNSTIVNIFTDLFKTGKIVLLILFLIII